ncbi:MAG: hypothetical protein ACOCQA_01365 [bacterium]
MRNKIGEINNSVEELNQLMQQNTFLVEGIASLSESLSNMI